MFLGCDSIKKLNELKIQLIKLFQSQETHQHFADDLAFFFIPIEKMDDETKDLLQHYYNNYILNNANIHRTYSSFMSNSQKATQLALEKNQQEIEKAKHVKAKSISAANETYRLEIESLEQQESSLDQTFKKDIEKLNLTSKREIASIDKEVALAKKTYQTVTQSIEKTQKDEIELLKQNYLHKSEELKLAFDKDKQEFDKAVAAINKKIEKKSKSNDEIYVLIKKNYNQLSINFNQKIGDLKKSHQTVLENIKIEHEELLKPLYEQKDLLKAEYSKALEASLIQYQDKLNALNAVFDVQKQEFENKKAKVIAEGNDAVSILNSKLTAFKESIFYEKHNITKSFREENPDYENLTKDQISKIVNRRQAALDIELNKQIIRTNRDILKKQKTQQQQFYLNEQKHIQDLNEWRLNKQLYEFEKKQNNAKIEANFNYNTSIYDQKIQIEIAYFKLKRDLIAIQRNIDLRKLETQLSISSVVQEREINLLSNDAFKDKSDLEQEIKNLEYEYSLKKINYQFESDKNQKLYELKLSEFNMVAQLEIEKAKVNRDSKLAESQIRIELNQAILQRNTHTMAEVHNNEKNILEYKRNQLNLELESQNKNINFDFQLEHDKRQFIINETTVKAQQLANQEKIMRTLKIFKNEVNYNQYLVETFIENYISFLSFHANIIKLIKSFYQFPAMPETFKQFLIYSIDLFIYLETVILEQVSTFKKLNNNYFEQKINDSIHETYLTNLNETNIFFDQQNEEIKSKASVFHDEIARLNQNSILLQTTIQTTLIKLENLKEDSELSTHEQYKKKSHLQSEIKSLKKDLLEIDKSIVAAERKLVPFEQEYAELEKKKAIRLQKLERHKISDTNHFNRYLNKHQAIYNNIERLLLHFSHNIKTYYQEMTETIYVTDQQIQKAVTLIETEISNAKNNTIFFQQDLLKALVLFYKDSSTHYYNILNSFRNSSNLLIKNLNTTYQTKKQGLIDKLNTQNQDIKSALAHIETKHKNQSIIDTTSYQKHIKVVQASIKDHEKDLKIIADKLVFDLASINNNLSEYVNQFPADEQKIIDSLSLKDNRLISDEKQKNDERIKQYALSNQALELKNMSILNRSDLQNKKIINQAKQKDLNDENEIKKAIINDQNKYHEHQKNAKLTIANREDEFKNINKHSRQFEHKTRVEQNKIMRKEIRILKKHHRFKLKMLKLN